ncbi:hypothetical protein [Verrucomicrobium spinosum]|uniref:hypothetical protein n=1 Tax=Verrucomicrobium spinosum TaxID=2736 RepID=UPI0001745866|nr:hypothetical protein [Verrucomicrobium spinosum]
MAIGAAAYVGVLLAFFMGIEWLIQRGKGCHPRQARSVCQPVFGPQCMVTPGRS